MYVSCIMYDEFVKLPFFYKHIFAVVEEEVQNIKKAGSRTRQPSIILPNNVHVNPGDVKIRYNELTMGRSLGHGNYSIFQVHFFFVVMLEN